MPDPAAKSADDPGRIATVRQGRLFLIAIDRPKKYNGFTPEMLRQLAEAYTEYERDDALWCAVLHAEGDHFTAGLQLSAFDITADLVPPGLVDPLALRAPFRRKPVVCAVKGICFTIGIELMLAADIVVAEQGTRFGQVEVKRGLAAYGGATIRFVERAGWGNAMRYLLTGDEFDAATAHRLGFVQEVVAKGEGLAAAMAIAERIAAQAPLAVRETRYNSWVSVREGQDAAVADLDRVRRTLAKTEDFAEGVRSFNERRDGDYRGR
ncbi:MAG: crotonase/enoyl-CoA hydratase family protein [Rhodospirillaceae bacterium]|nr:crotonase/enoyl-CoA hydratase family protein [Rhodospirillaceae bacterium]